MLISVNNKRIFFEFERKTEVFKFDNKSFFLFYSISSALRIGLSKPYKDKSGHFKEKNNYWSWKC